MMLVYDCNLIISAYRSPGDEGILDDDEEPKGPKFKDTEHFFNLIPRCWNPRTAGNKTVNSQTLVNDSIPLATIMVGSYSKMRKALCRLMKKGRDDGLTRYGGQRTRNRRLKYWSVQTVYFVAGLM
jgi:hypothetical protein